LKFETPDLELCLTQVSYRRVKEPEFQGVLHFNPLVTSIEITEQNKNADDQTPDLEKSVTHVSK
jgi:hypothetical protein